MSFKTVQFKTNKILLTFKSYDVNLFWVNNFGVS